jgi:hypothetical protein
MQSDDITVQILRDIRDEIRNTNARVDLLTDETKVRLDQLGDAVVGSEVRTIAAITALDGTLHAVHDALRSHNDLRDRVERCERDIAEIKHRVG